VSRQATGDPKEVARGYFTAIARQDLDEALACWRPGSIDYLAPVGELLAPDGMRTYFSGVFASFPDFTYEVREMIGEGDCVAVLWRARGTFTGRPLDGIHATGAALTAEGIDLVRVEDGLIVRIDSFWDDAATGRQIGLLPPRGSGQERLLIALFNLRMRLAPMLRRRSRH
jgi:predicted ester cyclase